MANNRKLAAYRLDKKHQNAPNYALTFKEIFVIISNNGTLIQPNRSKIMRLQFCDSQLLIS